MSFCALKISKQTMCSLWLVPFVLPHSLPTSALRPGLLDAAPLITWIACVPFQNNHPFHNAELCSLFNSGLYSACVVRNWSAYDRQASDCRCWPDRITQALVLVSPEWRC